MFLSFTVKRDVSVDKGGRERRLNERALFSESNQKDCDKVLD